MTISASAGTRISLVRLLTTGAVSPRNDATKGSSSPGARVVAANMSSGCAAKVKVMGSGFAAFHAGGVNTFEVGRCRHICAGLGTVAQAEPSATHVRAPGFGIDGVVDAGAEVATAIELVLRMKRQLGEIDIVAGHDGLVDRGFVGRDFDDLVRIGEPALVGLVDIVRRRVEGGGNTRAAAHDLGDDFEIFGPAF